MHMCRPGRVDAVQAHARTDTGPHLIGVPGLDLSGQLRIGHQRARHPDQIEQSLGDGVAGGRDVGDAWRRA